MDKEKVKRLEERLAELEAQLAQVKQERDEQLALHRKLLDSSRDGIALFDADFRLLYCNKNYRTVFRGLAPMLTRGRSVAEIARMAAESGLIALAGAELETWIESRSDPAQRTFDEPYLMELSDGAWIRACDYRTEDGGFLAMRTNVTEMKAREEALQATTEHMRNALEAFFENSPVPMLIKDTERRYQAVNKGFTDLHGVPEDRILGRTMEDVFPEMAASLGRSADYAVLEGVGPITREHKFFRPDGSEGLAAATKFPIRDADGNITAIGGISVDISRFIDVQSKLTSKSELLETTLRSIDQGFAVFDKNMKILACNRRFFELHDYPEDLSTATEGLHLRDMLQHFADLGAFGTDAPAEALERRWALLAGPDRPEREERTQLNGRILDVRRTALPDGGYVATFTEITDLKHAEQKAEAAHVLLRDILNTLRFSVCLYDADQRMVYCNEATRELFGWQMDLRRPGVTFEAQLRDAMAKKMVAGIEGAEEDWLRQRRQEFEQKAMNVVTERPGDQWTLTHFRATPDGGTVAVHSDITEQKRAERALRESEENFRTLVENSEIGITITLRRHILFANEAFARIFGYDTRDEVMERGHYDAFIAPRDLERVQSISDARTENRPAPTVYEFEGIRKDGTTFWLQRTSRVVTWNGTRATLGTVIDVTQRRMAEERLRNALDAAETANRTKSDFLAKMSHELRTPLNAIIGFSEVLARETFGPLGHDRYKSYVNDIALSGRHLLEMINDILDMSKIESGGYEIDPVESDIIRMIAETVQVVRGQIEQRRIDFKLVVDPKTPTIFADQRALRQILLNLLSNAIKFTPKGGEIRITTGPQEAGGLFLAVKDTGIGIGKADIENVLKPFNQGSNPQSTVQPGTGLGLPIVKSLAEMHGGRLTIESEPAHGTTVTIELPGRGAGGTAKRAKAS
jgi:two-component system cell cycle sensor histidine kinase PleC